MNTVKLLSVILFILSIGENYCVGQSADYKSRNFGLAYQFSYNNNTAHHRIPLYWNPNRHLFFLGPQRTSVIKPLGDPIDDYENESYGLNAGWQYTFKDIGNNMRLFFQYEFTYYQIKKIEHQLGPPVSTEHTLSRLENSLSAGVSVCLFERLFLKSNVGFGSGSGFFLLLDDNAFVTANVGIYISVF